MLCCSKVFIAKCFKGQGNAKGNTMSERTVLAEKDKLISTTLLSDRRGAVAFEMIIVYLFMMFGLLLPLADLTVAGFKFIAAWEAMRGFGQSIQYNTPDVTDLSAWTTNLPTAVAGYPINNVQVLCGGTNVACSTTNTAPPKQYSYTTTVTFAPIVLRRLMCTSGNANPCSFTLSYSERFQ